MIQRQTFASLMVRLVGSLAMILQQPHHHYVNVDEQSQSLSYVDLSLNPERYTGYAGPSAERIWKAVYRENCFL